MERNPNTETATKVPTVLIDLAFWAGFALIVALLAEARRGSTEERP